MTIQTQIDELDTMTLPQLQARFAEVLGVATRAPNKAYLVRRITEGLQAAAAAPPEQETQVEATHDEPEPETFPSSESPVQDEPHEETAADVEPVASTPKEAAEPEGDQPSEPSEPTIHAPAAPTIGKSSPYHVLTKHRMSEPRLAAG